MSDAAPRRITTGVDGLDEIMHGGLIPQRGYLVRGGPGTGKTTLGLHFLRSGTPSESLFISLGEPEAQLRANAEFSGLSLAGVEVLDLSAILPVGGESGAYNLLPDWEIEAGNIHDRILDHVRDRHPCRVFIDPLGELRYVSPDTFQFRNQVRSLLRSLIAGGATVLFTAEKGETSDDDLQFLADGFVRLEDTDSGRLCSVTKMRGSAIAAGWHYYELQYGGMAVYPRLTPRAHGRAIEGTAIQSGVPALDALTGGGIERGTVTLISGPSGVGKTTLGGYYMKEAAARGERSVIYNFDERRETFVRRSQRIGLPVPEMLDGGALAFREIDSLEYDPDRFALEVRREVEERNARIVMIDSLSGYRQSVRGDDLLGRVHALCRYLVNMGVTVLLVNEVYSVAGPELQVSEHGVSYLADTVLLLRYIELGGELRKTVGMLKKRTGDFEKTLREFGIGPDGLTVGPPLTGLRGIISGIPEVVNSSHATGGAGE